MKEEAIPGITLWFKSSSVGRPVNGEKFRVHLELDASVVDEELWNIVAARFRRGFHMYSRNDVQDEVIEVLRAKALEMEEKLKVAQRTIASEQAQRSALEQELARYKEPLVEFGRGLRGESQQ